MNIENKLKDEFKEVNKAFFDKEFGNDYLRVEVSLRDLNDLQELSKRISEFLDNNDPIEGEYYLDIYSPGTDESFDPKDSKDHVGENVMIELTNRVKDKDEFIGEILEASEESIKIRWNAKGQFRKQDIAIDNIKNIKKYTKVKK